MRDYYIVARAHIRSWWRRLRGRPDTLGHYLSDLGFTTVTYTIRPDRDVDAQIDVVCRDIAARVNAMRDQS